jgi:hypothetical protein
MTEIHRLWHSVHETFSGVPNSNIVRPDVNAIRNDTAKGARKSVMNSGTIIIPTFRKKVER